MAYKMQCLIFHGFTHSHFIFCIWYIPFSSKCVKFAQFHTTQTTKWEKLTILEDPDQNLKCTYNIANGHGAKNNGFSKTAEFKTEHEIK